MAKLPWMKFFPTNYLADTRGLPLSAKGAWMDLICYLWESPTRGQITLPFNTMALMLGTSSEALEEALTSLRQLKVAEISKDSHGNVTVMSRRITREENERESARLRKQKERGQVNVTELSRPRHTNVTPLVTPLSQQCHGERIEDRGQRIEDRIKESQKKPTDAPVDNPEKPLITQSQKDQLNKIAILVKESFKILKPDGRILGFNPYAFIQKNLTAHPDAIIKTLSRMIEDKAEIISPWAWAEYVLNLESQNYNSRDFQTRSEKDKSIYDEILTGIKELHTKKQDPPK